MGVKIHYRGTLNEKKQIHSLINEVKDIAKIMGWTYAALNEDWEQAPTAILKSSADRGVHIDGNCSLKGIHFRTKTDTDPVWLYFNANGTLSAPFQVALEAEEGYPMKKNWLSTSTQDAGIETHIAIIKLFRYLKYKYIDNLEVMDNTRYWEHDDKQELEQRFGQVGDMMNQVDQALTNIDPSILDNPELIDKMIEDLINELGEEEEAE